MVLVITDVAEAGPMLPAWSATELATRPKPMVLPLVQPLTVTVKVMLFTVVMTGVEAHPVMLKSLATRPDTASLKARV